MTWMNLKEILNEKRQISKGYALHVSIDVTTMK